MASDSSPFSNIDNALNRYYCSLGLFDYLNEDGIGKFLEMVQVNDFQEDEIEDELGGDVEDCMYLEFDNNFPIPPDQQINENDANQRQQFMFDIIKKCHNNTNITFKNYNIPQNKKENNNKKKEESKKEPIINRAATRDIIESHKGSKVLSVCDAIGRYYKSINIPYNRIFSAYCYENGINDLSEELDQEEASLCLLIEFDEKFPFCNELKNAKESDQQQFIFDLIKKCYNNPNTSFYRKLPSCLLSKATTKYLYGITEKEYNETREMYKIQCPTLWNGGMDTDRGFTYIISIGRKHKFDYYQYLVDDYLRQRIINIQRNYKEEEWAKNHPHFQSLQDVKFDIPWKNETKDTDKFLGKKSNDNNNNNNNNNNINRDPRDASELARSAVKSFGARCVPKMQFSHLISINDSLEIVSRYIDAAAGFIQFLLENSKNRNQAICPFQVDFCISFGEPKQMDIIVDGVAELGNNDDIVDEEDDDDDDDIDYKGNDDDSKDEEFVDCIGDIGGKLEKNKLKYMNGEQIPKQERDFEYMSTRGFSDILNEFIEKHDLEKDEGNEQKAPEIYMHNKRLIIFIDRRSKSGNKQQRTEKDDIWMYEAPKNCRNIPNDAVPEWHISASKTCLLPNMEYGDGKAAERGNKDPDKNTKNGSKENKSKEEEQKKLLNSNIGCSFHCKGALLTLSFIVKQCDDIKCYLYWNGQITRFYADDIKNILPKIINMKWNNGVDLKQIGLKKGGKKNKNKQIPIYEESENEIFLKHKEKKQKSDKKEGNDIDSIIQRIKRNITDKKFESFFENR